MHDALALFVEEDVEPGDAWPTIALLRWAPATRAQGRSYVNAALLGTAPELADGTRTPRDRYAAERLEVRHLDLVCTRLVRVCRGTTRFGKPRRP